MSAADAIKTLLKSEWTTSIPGRTTAVPDVLDAPEDGTGVLVLTNEEDLRVTLSAHDKIEVTQTNRRIEDKGSKSEKVVDEVQIDIRISARDTDGDGIREGVRARMLGERDANNDSDTLGGLQGETKRILNGIRKGFKEWDKSSHTVDQQEIRNSDARVTFTLELEIIERNIKQPL